MKHHEDETGYQGVVGGGKEGGVLLSFTISLLTGTVCKRAGERERERKGVNRNTKLPIPVAAAEQKRGREG